MRCLLHRICPLLAQSGHCHRAERCPLSGVKRTSMSGNPMSAFDPKRTSWLRFSVLQSDAETPFRRSPIPDVIAFWRGLSLGRRRCDGASSCRELQLLPLARSRRARSSRRCRLLACANFGDTPATWRCSPRSVAPHRALAISPPISARPCVHSNLAQS